MTNEVKNRLIVAVDGFSSTGKSTIAKDIAAHYGIRYIDSGAMYRAVTLFAINHKLIDSRTFQIDERKLRTYLKDIHIDFSLEPETKRQHIVLNRVPVDQDIRGMQVSNLVSYISKLGFVRKEMVEKQRMFAKEGGLAMDGRDIGHVVFPDADVKIFVTADPQIRAQRRYKELQEKGIGADFDEVLRNIKERDRIDQERAESPLRKAEDAFEMDNSYLTRAEQLQQALEIIEKHHTKY